MPARTLTLLRLLAATAVTAAVATLAGCSDAEADPASLAFRFDESFSVRDSAGVVIAESQSPAWAEGEGWTVGAEPTFVIGTIDGPDEYLFQSVRSAHRLPDGGVIFGEAGDGTVRRYDADGDHLWTVGGEGEGPGEFQCLRGLVMEDESVLAWQCNPVAASVRYGRDGEVVEILPTRGSHRGWVQATFSNGDPLLLGRDGPATRIDDRIVRIDRAHMRVSQDRKLDTLVVLPYQHEMTIPVVDESVTMLLTPYNVASLHRDTLYTGFNERYEIGAYDGGGTLHRIVRRGFEPEPVNEDSIRGLIDEALEQELDEIEDPTQRRAFRFMIRTALRFVVFPDFMPTYSEIRVAHDGHLWIRRDDDSFYDMIDLDPPAGPGRWDVFTPEGRWLGEVVTPPAFDIHEIGEDYLLGVVTNEFDVQFVASFPLQRKD